MMMALVAIVLMTASCSKGNENAKAIPMDAPVVVKADLKSLAEKGAMKDNKELQTQMQESLKSLSPALQAKAKAVIDDPMEAGFALQQPMFFAVADADKDQYVVAIGVDDKKKVDELLKSMKDDCKTMKITEGDDQTVIDDEDIQRRPLRGYGRR